MASYSWTAGGGHWSAFISDLDTEREHLFARCASPARKVRCRGWYGAWSPYSPPGLPVRVGRGQCASYVFTAESEEENCRREQQNCQEDKWG